MQPYVSCIIEGATKKNEQMNVIMENNNNKVLP